MKKLCADGGGPDQLASSWGPPRPVSSNSPRIIPWGLEEESQNQLSLVSLLPHRSRGKPSMCTDHTAEGEPGPQAPFAKPPGQALLPDSPGSSTTSLSWERATATHPTPHSLSGSAPTRSPAIRWPISTTVLWGKNGCSQRSTNSFNPGRVKPTLRPTSWLSTPYCSPTEIAFTMPGCQPPL